MRLYPGERLDGSRVRNPEAEDPAKPKPDSRLQGLWGNKCVSLNHRNVWDSAVWSFPLQDQAITRHGPYFIELAAGLTLLWPSEPSCYFMDTPSSYLLRALACVCC